MVKAKRHALAPRETGFLHILYRLGRAVGPFDRVLALTRSNASNNVGPTVEVENRPSYASWNAGVALPRTADHIDASVRTHIGERALSAEPSRAAE